MNTRSAPGDVFSLHSADELAQFSINLRPSNALTFPSPVSAKPFSVPAHDGSGTQSAKHVAPAVHGLDKCDPEQTVDRGRAWPFNRAFQYDYLLPKGEVLGCSGRSPHYQNQFSALRVKARPSSQGLREREIAITMP